MSDYGTAILVGERFQLTAEVELSNRIFPGWFGDVETGESYIAEFNAPAIDSKGNRWLLFWQFEQVKGCEEEADSLNWEEPTWVKREEK
jgi:hypothetical protein